MVIVNAVFLDADDSRVKSHVIPCESTEVAKKLIKKLAIEAYVHKRRHYFDTEEELKKAYKEGRYGVYESKDGMEINVEGYEGGYAEFTVIEADNVVTEETINDVDLGEDNIF